MIRRHSTLAHAAYFDLLASLKDEAVAELRGTPTRVARKGKVYGYDTFRIGADVRKTYLGEDSHDRARLARHGEIAARRYGDSALFAQARQFLFSPRSPCKERAVTVTLSP